MKQHVFRYIRGNKARDEYLDCIKTLNLWPTGVNGKSTNTNWMYGLTAKATTSARLCSWRTTGGKRRGKQELSRLSLQVS